LPLHLLAQKKEQNNSKSKINIKSQLKIRLFNYISFQASKVVSSRAHSKRVKVQIQAMIVPNKNLKPTILKPKQNQ
jgi:hypothetical protein